MNVGLDQYARNARLKPALLALAPAAWSVTAWSPEHALGWGGFWGLFVAVGGTMLFANLARDRGKRKEKALFESQGGRPTERLLSHAQAPNKVSLAQRHAKLRRLVPDVHIPSEAEEAADHAASQDVYAACVDHLIARSRDDRLLFQENISYGFRRNLWGLKPVGVVVSTASAIVLGLRLVLEFRSEGAVSSLVVAFEISNLSMSAVWLFVVTPSWVTVPAYAYAERLMETLDRM